MLNILRGDVFLILMKTWLIQYQQILKVHIYGYKDLMKEDGSYGASGVLVDEGK